MNELVEAIEQSDELPEFTADVVNSTGKVTKYGNVFAANGLKPNKGKDLRDHVQYAVSKNDGLMLLFYGREGKNTSPRFGDIIASVTMKCELYIDPIRYLKKDGVRGVEELENAVLSFIHGLKIGNDRHCNQSLRVEAWREVGDPDFYVTGIDVVRQQVSLKEQSKTK